jgi:hypothetical protein
LDEYFTSVFFSFYGASAVNVKNDEDKRGDDGSEGSEEVRIGNEEESFEFIMFVRTNSDSLSFFDEIISWFLVNNLVLINAFLQWGLNKILIT